MNNPRNRFNHDGSAADRYTEEQASAARQELRCGGLPPSTSDQTVLAVYSDWVDEGPDDDHTEKEDPSLYE